ncbi:MAG: helix-turn-helix domain-containing protein [Planctomycetia bacterium]|nr:helix-turn-helix domain-containing protein [Planctomycetia bacterium]
MRIKRLDRDLYLERVKEFPLTSIRSAQHCEQAQAVLDKLLSKVNRLNGEELYLDALSDLVATYEDQHRAIEPASDADLLQHLLEAKGVSQAQLHRETGIAKSTISEILSGKKPFSRQMMRTLAKYFNVDVSLLAVNL